MNTDIRQIEENLERMSSEIGAVIDRVDGCIDDLRMIADGPDSVDKSAAMHQIADSLAQIVGRED